MKRKDKYDSLALSTISVKTLETMMEGYSKRRRENLSNLSDEKLIKRYQDEEISRKDTWAELLDRYLGLIEGLFYQRFGWLGFEKSDLFDSTFKLALERRILKNWKSTGKSVKNWLIVNLVYWLPKDTDFYKEKKNQNQHYTYVKENELDKLRDESSVSIPVMSSENYELSDYLKGLETKALNFLDEVLNNEDSTLVSKRKEGRRRVLSILKENSEKGIEGIMTDGEKSKEVEMSESSFAMRKIRALDDLIEEINKRGYPAEIIVHLGPILNYRIDSLVARSKELKEKQSNI